MFDRDDDDDINEDSSSGSSFSSTDFDSSDSDLDELKPSIKVPSVTLIFGKSRSGKSTFVLDCIYSRIFDIKPEMLYLVIGSSNHTALVSKSKPFITAFLDTYSPEMDDCIKLCGSLDELSTILSEETDSKRLNAPKLVIVDDMMTTDKKPEAIQKIVSELSHHCNAAAMLSTQQFFISGGRSMKDNADYQVVFRGSSFMTLKRFLSDLPASITQNILQFFASQDKDKISSLYGTKFGQPIIIDNNVDNPSGSTIIWRGFEDRDPMIVNEDNRMSSAIKGGENTGEFIRDLITKYKHKNSSSSSNNVTAALSD